MNNSSEIQYKYSGKLLYKHVITCHLIHSMLDKFSADNILKYFSNFSRKQGFDIL